MRYKRNDENENKEKTYGFEILDIWRRIFPSYSYAIVRDLNMTAIDLSIIVNR